MHFMFVFNVVLSTYFLKVGTYILLVVMTHILSFLP